MSKRMSKGIKIRRFRSKHARQLMFTKRRAGVFKRLRDLGILCGGEPWTLVFSPSGWAFSYGHSSDDSIFDNFLAESIIALADSSEEYRVNKMIDAASVNGELTDDTLMEKLVNELGLDELEDLRASLESIKLDAYEELVEKNGQTSVPAPFVPLTPRPEDHYPSASSDGRSFGSSSSSTLPPGYGRKRTRSSS